jgi:predicted nucleic acid-binding protein
VIVLLDASVLYPAPLRDLLMHLAQTTLFKARWSNLIHDEWTRNVLEDRPDLTAAQIARTRALMDAHIDGAVVADFEDLIPSLNLPDPDDRHVLAAAIRGEAHLIVTMNLKHFPTKELAAYGIEPIHPDAFVMRLLEINTPLVLVAIKKQRSGLTRPPLTQEEMLEVFELQGLNRTVWFLGEFIAQI